MPSSDEKRECIRKAQQTWQAYEEALDHLLPLLPNDQQKSFRQYVECEMRSHWVDLKLRYRYDDEVGLHSGECHAPALSPTDSKAEIQQYRYTRDGEWNRQ